MPTGFVVHRVQCTHASARRHVLKYVRVVGLIRERIQDVVGIEFCTTELRFLPAMRVGGDNAVMRSDPNWYFVPYKSLLNQYGLYYLVQLYMFHI